MLAKIGKLAREIRVILQCPLLGRRAQNDSVEKTRDKLDQVNQENQSGAHNTAQVKTRRCWIAAHQSRKCSAERKTRFALSCVFASMRSEGSARVVGEFSILKK